MSKCIFCGEDTNGKKFIDKSILTHKQENFDVCNNCCGDDLELVKDKMK